MMRRLLPNLAVLAVLISAWGRADEIPGPRPMDSRVAMVVTTLIGQDHLSRHPLDDEISQRAMHTLLRGFDRMKLYFTQQDIDEFMQNDKKLDDLLKDRDMQFAFQVFARFQKRVEERMKLVDELLQGEFDFTKDEEVVVDPDTAKYSSSDEELRERWRKRLKYELLLLKADKVELAEAKETVAKRYRNFSRVARQMSHDDVLERYLTAVASSYDPHTSYFSPSTLDDFRIRLGLNYEGIGAELEPSDSGLAVIRRLIKGGGAEKGGQLKPKDRIVSVGQGEEGEMVDVRDKRLDDVIELIRGPEGTVVRLGVIPDGKEELQTYSITRSRVELEDSGAKSKVLEAGTKEDGSPYRIGLIELPSFYMDMEAARRGEENFKSTTRDVRQILDQFKEKHVDAVVLDLRSNGGGSLTEAIGTTGLFIDGPVVQVKDSNGRIQKHNDSEPGMAWDGPLVIMTSKFSASASEILAGAVQDYRRGLIVGDSTTHGKGTVQSLIDLGRQLLHIDLNLGALKITMQQFYRPNGQSTQNKGVEADIVLPSISNFVEGEKDLDYAMAFDQVPAASFETHHLVSDQILAPLRAASEARRQQSSDFQKLTASIERYQQERNRKTMPLQESKFLTLRNADDADDADAEPSEPDPHPDEEDDEKPDFYIDEVLTITVDYVKALAATKEG